MDLHAHIYARALHGLYNRHQHTDQTSRFTGRLSALTGIKVVSLNESQFTLLVLLLNDLLNFLKARKRPCNGGIA